MKEKSLFLAVIALSAVCCQRISEPAGCEDFEVLLPEASEGRVVYASDFGFSTESTLNASAIQKALDYCKETSAARLELAPGTYRCYDEPGFVLDSLTGFTLDGKGAVLVFRRPVEYRCQPQSDLIHDKGNVGIRHCKRILVENFIIDWDWENDPLAARVKVISTNVDRSQGENSYVDFLLPDYERHPKYPNPVPVQIFIPMDSTGTHFRKGTACYMGMTEGHFGAKNQWMSPNVLRVWPNIPMEGKDQNPATGYRYSAEANLQKVENFHTGETYKLQHYYYGKNGINMDSNTNLTLRNVTVWSCFGMALVVDGHQQYWQIENFRVVPPTREEISDAYPGRDFFERPVTSTSDGHHVARSNGWCKYISCEWCRNNDDASNFHDRFTIAARASDKVLDIMNRRGADYFRAEPGAEVELRYPNFSPTGYFARIVKVEGNRITVDKTIPRQKGQCFLVFDRSYGTNHVLMRGCKFTDIGGRTIFSPSHLTIEECQYKNVMGLGIRIIADYRSDRWCEGMGASDIVIRGCTFENTCIKYPQNPVLSAACVFPEDWEVGEVDPGFVGGKLLIENNTFIRPYGPAIDLSTGDDVTVRGNIVDMRGIESPYPDAGGILHHTQGKVTVVDNIILKD